MMRTLRKSKRALGWTAWHTIGTYGALRHAQGRMSGKLAARSRGWLFAAAGSGLAVGLTAGFAIRSRLGSGCGHDHEHGHHEHGRHDGHEPADIPVAAAAGEQATDAKNGVVTA